ncbi:hypothetical protein HDU99_010732 [Rhizoclosmatium hyalinum]|nr:hypothetical protein HDU99_010732 [Rhizoclosmatium hyalinum]
MCEQVLASTLFGSTSQPVSLSEDVAEFTEDPLVPFLIHAKENEPLITLTYALLLTQHIKSSDEDNADESKLTLLTTLVEILEAAPWSKCSAHMDLDILIKTRIYCCLYAQDNSVDPTQAFTKPNNIPKIPSLVQTSAPAAKKSKGASGLAANSKSKKSAARAAETAKLQHSSQSKKGKKRATPEEAEFVQEHEEADDGAGEESDEDEDDEQEKIRKQVELMTQEVIRITNERKTAESANLKASEPRRTVVKTAWTQEEIDALEDGMKTYGAKWSVIGRQKKELKNRNQVQIKDKARNMLMKKIKSGADFGVWALVYTPALQALVEKQIGQKFVLVDGKESEEQTRQN